MYIASNLLILVLLISVGNIIYSRRNAARFVTLCFVVCVFSILIFNRQNQDYDAYVDMFVNPSEYAEFGYVVLIETLKAVGFESHTSVQFVLAVLISSTIFRLKNYSKGFPLFLIFYTVFLFPLDLIQIRNTIAVFLMVNALLFLFNKKYYYFLLASFVAMSFHYISVLFLIMVLLGYFLLRIKRFKNLIVIFFAALGFPVVHYLTGLASITSIRTLDAYLSDGKISSVVIWAGLVCSYLLVIQLLQIEKIVGVIEFDDVIDETLSNHFSKFVYNIIYVSLVFSGGLYFLFEFNRVYRFILFLIIIHAGSIVYKMSSRGGFVLICYLAIVNFALALYYSSQLNYDHIIFGIEP